MESKLLVIIKKGGAKICGIYTGNSAPSSGFNTLTKVWNGTNAVAFLGQDCVLTPGDYEICVQFFGNGPAGVVPLSEEKTKAFSIRATEQQTNPIGPISISLPASPDANTANWGSGTSILTITATTKAENGKVAPRVMESKLLVTIKKHGAKICGTYNATSAPESNFNTLIKVWSGSNAVSFLGQDCVLPPGDYEICVQFFGNGPVGMAPLSEEKCKPFSIREKEQQIFQSPQIIAPAEGTILSEADAKKPITFRWIPVIPRPQDPVTYRLTIWELEHGQSGTQAMIANQPLFTKDVVNLTQTFVNNLTTVPCLPPYFCDFIWNVQALNHEGKPIGENNGTSKPSVFNIANNEQIKNSDGKGDIVDQKGIGTIILDLPLEPDDTTLFIIYSGVIGFNSKDKSLVANPEEKVGGEACKDFSVVFMEDRKIYRGDSVSNGLMQKRKIYKGDSISSSLNTDLMEKRKIYRGDSITYECTITNNYRGDNQANKPKSFRIKVNNDLIIAVYRSIAGKLTRTPSKFPPGSSQIKWTNNSGDIPNGKTKLGIICFEHVKTGPITVIYEWLNKDEKVICSGIIVMTSTAGEVRDILSYKGGNSNQQEETRTNPDLIKRLADPEVNPELARKIPDPTARLKASQTVPSLLYPSSNRPPTSNRPTFEWKIEKQEVGSVAVKDVIFEPNDEPLWSIVVKELEEGKDIESGKILFERGGIRENVFRYPTDAPNLDSTKSYGWQVSMIKNGKLVGMTPFSSFKLLKVMDKADGKPDARKYYELGKVPSNTITKISNETLDVQFFNKYASAENIKLTIYDVEAQKIKRKSRDVIKLNSVTGLNRISIDIKDYNLEPGRLYLLTISDSHTDYNFNFRVTNDREK
ncbi:MAG: hypothetical protein NTZ69_16275 [Bacteroidia bacterium]|nr:hypothetical protein [Bacteroidia bacterium]